MSNLSQFFGGGGIKPKSIVGRGLPNNIATAPAGLPPSMITGILSGACTANTLKTVLSVAGRGALTWLGASPQDTTSRTTRLKITLDGTVIFDATSAAGTTSGRWILAHGTLPGQSTSGVTVGEGTPLLFDSSLLIGYASSVSETDKCSIGYIYYTR